MFDGDLLLPGIQIAGYIFGKKIKHLILHVKPVIP